LSNESLTEQIQEITKLRDNGAISVEEFERAKQRLLERFADGKPESIFSDQFANAAANLRSKIKDTVSNSDGVVREAVQAGSMPPRAKVVIVGAIAVAAVVAVFFLLFGSSEKDQFMALCMKSPGVKSILSQICSCTYDRLLEIEPTLISSAIRDENGQEKMSPSDTQSVFFVAAQCGTSLAP